MEGLIEYFEQGCERESDFQLGLEIEHFIIDKKTKRSIAFLGEVGVQSILEKLSAGFTYSFRSDGYLFSLERKDILITIEPGSQLEVSIVPKKNVSEIEIVYRQFLDELLLILDQYGYELVNYGYLPCSKADEIVRIPKKRYEYMETYFNKIGSGAKYMMKGTGAVHVSIDYTSEKDFSAKYKLAVLLSPVIAFVMENTPVFEGKPYKKHLLRDTIWSDVDADRVSVDSFWKNNEMTFAGYADFVTHAPLIVDRWEDEEVYSEKTASDQYKNRTVEYKDIEHILGMVFPEIRLKSYIEIRSADSNSFSKTMRYLRVIENIFRSSEGVLEYLKRFSSVSLPYDVAEAKENIKAQGENAVIYHKPIKEWIKIFGMEDLRDENE